MTQQRDQSGITRLGCRPVPVKEEAGVATPATGNTGGDGRGGGGARRSESARETLRIVVLDTYPCTQLVHTDATMHIRRLLGNGFGLLMTGQLSQQPACIPREPPPLTHAHRSYPRPIVKRASIETRVSQLQENLHRGFCFFLPRRQFSQIDCVCLCILNTRMRSRKICKYLFTVHSISTVDRIDIEETVCAVAFGEKFRHEEVVCTHIFFISERFHFYGLMMIPNLCVFYRT